MFNLNKHFPTLIPDELYLTDTDPPYFRPLAAPTIEALQPPVPQIAMRVGQQFEWPGLLVRYAENNSLALGAEGSAAENSLADL